ncbi:MAG: hypothetical protein Q8R38_06310 [Candidatus Omnitrophota bacterium]|nr:hypothetical protein [Candidatus Omnitrophota bacterium]
MKAQNKRYILIIIAIALVIKLSLFLFAAIHAPQGKLLPDSYGYLKLSDMLTTKGVFATQNENGALTYEMFRTPGYPLFLAILNGILKIPLDGVVLLQIAMTFIMAFIVYRATLEIDQKIALLSALMWDVCERLRVPMMPFIAIISAYGWCLMIERVQKNRPGNG